MLEDTFESMEDEDEMEEEAEMEIDKILFEITAGESLWATRSPMNPTAPAMRACTVRQLLGVTSQWLAELLKHPYLRAADIKLQLNAH